MRPNRSMRSRTVTWSPPHSEGTRDGSRCNREVSPAVAEGTDARLLSGPDGNCEASPPIPEGTDVRLLSGPDGNCEASPPIPEGTRKGMPLLYDGNGLRDSCIVGAGLAPALAPRTRVNDDVFS